MILYNEYNYKTSDNQNKKNVAIIDDKKNHTFWRKNV